MRTNEFIFEDTNKIVSSNLVKNITRGCKTYKIYKMQRFKD